MASKSTLGDTPERRSSSRTPKKKEEKRKSSRKSTKTELDLSDEDAKELNIFSTSNNGFLRFYETGLFCDLLLQMPDGVQYKVHQAIVAYTSPYLADLLPAAQVLCAVTKVIDIPWQDEDKIMPVLIHYMYSGKAGITPLNAVLLSATAERFQIPQLQQFCQDYISSHLQRENAMDILIEASKYKAQNLMKRSINIVARNFCHIPSSHAKKLHPKLLLKVIQQKKLAVSNEYDFYKTINEYIQAKQDILTEEETQKLWNSVRFRWIAFEQFEEVSHNPNVPKHLIIEATMNRLMAYELPPEEIEKRPQPIRLQPRPKVTLTFEFNEDDPEFFKGILYWISTNSNKDVWKNPHIAGRVKVHSSSLAKGTRSSLVDKVPAEFWTNDVPSSWISIDFGPHRRITPTHYSLRHGGNFQADSLRTWDLQGSTDGIQWKNLKRHTLDKSLNTSFGCCSWPVPGITEAFRFFRILQTGHNSSSHNFLVMSGFEFFGMLDSD